MYLFSVLYINTYTHIFVAYGGLNDNGPNRLLYLRIRRYGLTGERVSLRLCFEASKANGVLSFSLLPACGSYDVELLVTDLEP